MKQKEKTLLVGMSTMELRKRAAELEEKLVQFRLKQTTTQVKNLREGKTMRKTIAFLLTLARAKEIATGAKEVNI